MPSETTNPYRSPPELDDRATLFDGPLHFHGAVTFDDIVDLMGTPFINRLMRWLAAIILAPMLVLPIAIMFFRSTGLQTEPWGMLGMVLGLSAIVMVADRLVSPRVRAKRLLKRHPELIGPIRGRLDAFGLTYDSQTDDQMHQFSWAAFPVVAVLPKGIRLDWKAADRRFVAIPATSIDGYSCDRVKNLINQFRSQATHPAIYQSVPRWDAAPEGTLKFRGSVQAKPPASPSDVRKAWICCGIGHTATVAAVLLFLFDFSGELIAFSMVVAVVVQVTASRMFSQIAPARYAFGIWGWLTPQGGQTHWPGITSQFNWADANQITTTDDQIVASFDQGSYFQIAPEDLLCDVDPSENVSPKDETTIRDTDAIQQQWKTLQGWVTAARSNK